MELTQKELLVQVKKAINGQPHVLIDYSTSQPGLFQIMESLLTDIHEVHQNQAETYLYKQFFEKSGDAISIIENGKFSDSNLAAMKQFKYGSKDEIRKVHPSELSPEFQPDGQLSYRKAEKIMQSTLEKGSSRFEWQHELANSERFMAEIVLTTLINEPGRQVFHSAMRDISDQKAKETHLVLAYEKISSLKKKAELILQSAGEGIYGLDTNGYTTFANQAAVNIVGYTQDEMLGQSQHDLIHHSHTDGNVYKTETCHIYKALRDGQVHKVDHEVFWHKDGTPIPVEYTSTPIIDDEGEIEGAVVCFRDISARIKTQRELESALEEVRQLKDQLEVENEYLQQEIKLDHNFEEIISKSKIFRKVLNDIESVAQTDATVLIQGESGTGKELLARAVHSRSPRNTKALVKVNCAALPATLIESELFGHKKGAFTGALSDKPGRFQLADNGSIFLDEIGELPLDLQSKLLRVLQEGEFEVLGDTKTQKVDVRIIAATNVELHKAVKAGKFREDLYYRLNVFPIKVPPLRERTEDISLLAQHFVLKHSSRLGRNTPTITRSCLNKLIRYSWPGNVRELENIIERSIITSQGGRLTISPILNEEVTEETSVGMTLQEVEKAHIIKVLDNTNWKVSGEGGAAQILGVKRTTLEARMARLGIRR